VAIEPVLESSVSTVEERSQEDHYRWWKMGLRVNSNDKSFYENFETHGILQRFLNPWYLTKVLKPMVFYGGFETHGILRRFLNPWHLTGVLKGFS